MKAMMVLAGLMLAGSAMAQDHRCQDARGEYWSTSPCPPGERFRESRPQPQRSPRQPLEITATMKSDAVTACEPAVQRLARANYRWTARTVFGRWSLTDVIDNGDGTITIGGDRIEMQNQFGNWVRHRYVCIFDPATKRVVDVGAEPGQF